MISDHRYGIGGQGLERRNVTAFPMSPDQAQRGLMRRDLIGGISPLEGGACQCPQTIELLLPFRRERRVRLIVGMNLAVPALNRWRS